MAKEVGEIIVYFQDVFKTLDIRLSEVRKVEMKKWGGTSKSGCELLFSCSLIYDQLRQSVGMQGYVCWPLTFIYLEWL